MSVAVQLSGGQHDGQHVPQVPADQPGVRGAAPAHAGHRERPAQAPAQPGVLHHPVPGEPPHPG